jgi:hypothetical protein
MIHQQPAAQNATIPQNPQQAQQVAAAPQGVQPQANGSPPAAPQGVNVVDMPSQCVLPNPSMLQILQVMDPKNVIQLTADDDIAYKVNGKFVNVEHAKVDTGASVSVCGMDHFKACKNVYTITPVLIQSASGEVVVVRQRGEVEVKVNGKDIGHIQVLMVENENWKHFLLGRKQLIASGVTFVF